MTSTISPRRFAWWPAKARFPNEQSPEAARASLAAALRNTETPKARATIRATLIQ